MSKPRLLFVCLGNICRSPLAEAAFRKHAADAGLDAEADSAGTAAYHVGKSPDPRSVREAAKNGIDIARYSARQIDEDDFFRFTHIFALDQSNLHDLRAMQPVNSTAELALLLDTLPHKLGVSVVDPYYGDEEGFAETWQDVSEAGLAIVTQLSAPIG